MTDREVSAADGSAAATARVAAPGSGSFRFDSVLQRAYLNLWRTYDRLRAVEDECFASFDLTAQQYNVLRLLKAEPNPGLPTLLLAERLISRAPDITRMIDKLEARGLVERVRSQTDRRTVLVSLTTAGRALVKQIAVPLAQCHQRQLGHLSADELNHLVTLLEAARGPHEPEHSPWRLDEQE